MTATPAGNEEFAALAGSLVDAAISNVAAKPMWRPSGRFVYAHPDGESEEVSWFELSAYKYRDRLVSALERLANLKADDAPNESPTMLGLIDQVDDELRFVGDPGGYFWSQTTDAIVQLPGHQVRRLARCIAPTITSVTKLFVREVVPLTPRWDSVLAQPIDLTSWLKGARAKRADFIARCPDGYNVHVWDLKTSAAPQRHKEVLLKRSEVDAKYAQPLRQRGFRTHTRVIAATQGADDAWVTDALISEP